MTHAPTQKTRDPRLGPSGVSMEQPPDGVYYVRSTEPLGPYPVKLNERLEYWADRTPGQTLFAKRRNRGDWERLTFADAREKARNIGQAFVNRGLSPDRPIAILSGNDLDQAALHLGA